MAATCTPTMNEWVPCRDTRIIYVYSPKYMLSIHFIKYRTKAYINRQQRYLPRLPTASHYKVDLTAIKLLFCVTVSVSAILSCAFASIWNGNWICEPKTQNCFLEPKTHPLDFHLCHFSFRPKLFHLDFMAMLCCAVLCSVPTQSIAQ